MFFRKKNTDSMQDIRAKLTELEQNAAEAHGPGGGAVFYNRAGDLLVDAGRVTNALEYYGQAIDTHVKADRFDPASALCRKVIRLVPEVVRTRCTLTWLSLGEGFDMDAQKHLETYVDAARYAGQEDAVVRHVRRMSAVAGTDTLRLYLAELMLMMGDETGADHLFGAVYRERNLLDPKRNVAPDERRYAARRAALQGALYSGW